MKRRAFTLIELLVVIAIIALLAAIIVPVVGSVQARAKQTACASNMRQIGAGILLYTNENNGDFPQTTHGQAHEKSWVFTLKPYVGDVDKIRLCPADPKGEERLRNGGTSYVLNEYIAVPLIAGFPRRVVEDYTNIRRLPRPSSVMIAFIGADSLPAHVTADHTHSRTWFSGELGNWDLVLQDIQPDRHRSGSPSPDRTRGSANYLFGDGHVENIEATEFKKRMTTSGNFVKPNDQ